MGAPLHTFCDSEERNRTQQESRDLLEFSVVVWEMASEEVGTHHIFFVHQDSSGAGSSSIVEFLRGSS